MSEVTPERFARLKDLFAVASELPEGERRARLQQLTDDPALIDEALTLARENDGGGATVIGRSPVAIAPDSELEVGDSLGAWKLVEVLGRGGMGAVFRAERADGHFRQASAIKILKGRPSSEKLLFLAKERQILASLSHPNIARLLDGGATPGGQPYLVMEHVDGMPLDAYCNARHLERDRRLKLFLDVCDAISFAHQRLVIHCDIKPANVLVDRRGRVVLLDFGISRLMGDAVGDAIAAFTPKYASPEQRAGEALGTASDVFGLGRLLEAIASEDAKPEGELARIVEKATAAAPADRYPSVFLLAEDVRRLLDHRPLRAIPSTPWYRFRKLTQRRPIEVIVAVVFVLVILVFAHRVNQERDEAIAARKEAEAQRDRALQAAKPDSSAAGSRLTR